MNKLITVIALILCISACGDSGSDNNSGQKINPNKLSKLRETIVNDLEANSSVAVSVAIYKDGEVVFTEAFGEKVKGSGQVATPDTLFQLGSTTKMFTGIAALQLMEKGLLQENDKLVDILPDIQYPGPQASSWEDIIIYDLMTHQSGLSDTYIGSDVTDQLKHYMESTYPIYNRQMNPPGRFFNYSNPNWSYLGAVIEHLSEKKYSDYMLQNVFEALEMKRTSVGRGKALVDGDYALGFQNIDGVGLFLSDINQIPETPVVEPAGSETWSTPSDLLKMAEFLLKGESNVLTEQKRLRITKPHVSQEFAGLPMSYGFGVFVDDGFLYDDQWYPERIWHHAGNTTAYTSMFWILPDQNVAVSIMSSGDFNDFENTMFAALDAVANVPEPIDDIPYGNVDKSEFKKHEGLYDFGEFTIAVIETDDNLEISSTEFDANNVPYEPTLYPIGSSTFVAIIENEEVTFTFLPDIDGEESVFMRNRNLVGLKLGY